jgi:hypothetical protein
VRCLRLCAQVRVGCLPRSVRVSRAEVACPHTRHTQQTHTYINETNCEVPSLGCACVGGGSGHRHRTSSRSTMGGSLSRHLAMATLVTQVRRRDTNIRAKTALVSRRGQAWKPRPPPGALAFTPHRGQAHRYSKSRPRNTRRDGDNGAARQAHLCFSPPLSLRPLSPTTVSYLSGSDSMKGFSWAACDDFGDVTAGGYAPTSTPSLYNQTASWCVLCAIRLEPFHVHA